MGDINDERRESAAKLASILRMETDARVQTPDVEEELRRLSSILESQSTLIERLSPTKASTELRQLVAAAKKLKGLLRPPNPMEPLSSENDPFGLLLFSVAASLSPHAPEQFCGWDGPAHQKLEEIRGLIGNIEAWAKAAEKSAETKKLSGRGGVGRKKHGLEPYAVAYLMGAFERLTGQKARITNTAEGQPSGAFVEFCYSAMQAIGRPISKMSIKGHKDSIDATPELFQHIR